MTDLARLAGVSESSIFRLLHGKDGTLELRIP
jgi:DNA-binding MurR/RpiR family transcriptional regulator